MPYNADHINEARNSQMHRSLWIYNYSHFMITGPWASEYNYITAGAYNKWQEFIEQTSTARQSSSKILRKINFFLKFSRVSTFCPPLPQNQCWSGVILKTVFMFNVSQPMKAILHVQTTFATLIWGEGGFFVPKSNFLNVFCWWLSEWVKSHP